MGMLAIRERNAARGYTVHTVCVHASTRFDRFGDEVCCECGMAVRFGVCPPNAGLESASSYVGPSWDEIDEADEARRLARPVRRNTQNSHGDTVCWSCKGDAYACDCPPEDEDTGECPAPPGTRCGCGEPAVVIITFSAGDSRPYCGPCS